MLIAPGRWPRLKYIAPSVSTTTTEPASMAERSSSRVMVSAMVGSFRGEGSEATSISLLAAGRRVQDRLGVAPYAVRMQPELRLIRYFVAVAEEGNVTRAAERLHIAQPPLSAAVRQLEQQLGVRLLDRTGRRVKLTAAGALLAERGRALLAEADALVSAVRAVEQDPSGLLRAGFSPAGRFGVAPTLLARWGAAAPGVMVHTREDTTGALLRDVRD